MAPFKKYFLLILAAALIALPTSCGASEPEADFEATLAAVFAEETAQVEAAAPAEEAPTEEPPAPPPPEPPAEEESSPEILLAARDIAPDPERTLQDVLSWYLAHEHIATDGDRFLDSMYERPFTSDEMIYQPDLDIISVDFAPSEDFFYFTIRVYGPNMEGGGLQGLYGIEIDEDLDGRGDLFVTVENAANDWSTKNIIIYRDENNDVGGPQPLVADAGFNGSGYDMTVEMGGDVAAFARIDPADELGVQFALTRALLESPDEFLWGAWADNGLRDPAQFDYNDRMGPSAAGSPLRGEDYPVKLLYNLDNTCRLPYGFAQSGNYPGMCKIGIPPTKKPGKPGEPNCYCLRPPGAPQSNCSLWVCD